MLSELHTERCNPNVIFSTLKKGILVIWNSRICIQKVLNYSDFLNSLDKFIICIICEEVETVFYLVEHLGEKFSSCEFPDFSSQ